jgi:iron(III) transport system substrate-binding protein
MLAHPPGAEEFSVPIRNALADFGRATASVVALACCLAPSAVLAQGASLAELAMYSGPDRTQRLIAGAKREGMVSIYTSLTVDDMKVFGGAFEKKYGIKLQLWRSSSEDILQRAVVEARGGRFDVDAIETSAAEMESLHREKLLQEVRSPYIADLNPAALLPHREWVGDRLNLITSAYNTDLIKPAALPKTYDDLIDPKWKGKLGIEADDAIWFGALVTALGEEKGLKLFRELARANGLSLRKGHTLLANLVVSGEVPFTLTAYQYKVEQLKKSGAPIEWYVIPPGISRFLGTGVLRRAPHPHAAVLFLDFMLSDAQKLLLDRDFMPTNMKVKPLEIPFKVIDPAQMLDEGDKWSKLYQQIWSSRAGRRRHVCRALSAFPGRRAGIVPDSVVGTVPGQARDKYLSGRVSMVSAAPASAGIPGTGHRAPPGRVVRPIHRLRAPRAVLFASAVAVSRPSRAGRRGAAGPARPRRSCDRPAGRFARCGDRRCCPVGFRLSRPQSLRSATRRRRPSSTAVPPRQMAAVVAPRRSERALPAPPDTSTCGC